MRSFLGFIALAIWVAALPAPGQDAGKSPAGSSNVQSTVGPEDTLTIVVLNGEEISKQWRVGASGELNLPMVGTLHVSGKTVEQIEQEIATKLRPYILDPQVTVYVSELRSRAVTVTGAVANPGILQLRAGGTLFAAIMLAGGFKTSASQVTLTRPLDEGRIEFEGARDSDGKFSILQIPVKDIADGHSPAANVLLQPRDVISVAQDDQQRLVHIMGDVLKPGAVELVSQNKISLVKVLAVAGGLTHTSSPGNTRIRHIGPEGVQSEVSKVDLKAIIEGKAKDIELSPGDIVDVPSSNLKFYLQTAPQSALAAGFFILGRF